MINAAVLTISDSASAGTRGDRSGPAVRERLEQLGWRVSVVGAIGVPGSPFGDSANLAPQFQQNASPCQDRAPQFGQNRDDDPPAPDVAGGAAVCVGAGGGSGAGKGRERGVGAGRGSAGGGDWSGAGIDGPDLSSDSRILTVGRVEG